MISSAAEMEAPANIRVLVRVRPFSDREARSSHLEIDDSGMTSAIDFGMGDDNSTTANDRTINGGLMKESKGTVNLVDQSLGSGGYGSGYDSGANNSNYSSSATSRSFTYDAVFGPQSKQVQIFDSIKGIVDAVCAGYNGTIVAYGQTGSGKTYTIFGEPDRPEDDDNVGLIQRSLKSIFDKIARQSVVSPNAADSGTSIRTTTKASFFEIYNERVYDLLSPNENMIDDDKGLLVREDAMKGVYVEGLAEVDVSDTTEAMDVLRGGLDNRRVASTKMNRVSSRSHALFVLTVKSELFSENGISKVRTSKFTLVDLAGSERQKTTAADGDRLKEACNINNSLLCLGQVINALVDREKGKLNHVAFRNTNLTFLLRDSFGGNSKTCLVATVSPSYTSLTETVSTLKFAQRAKLIKNTAVLNENTCGTLADLQSEIARLRAELELKQGSVKCADKSTNDRGLPPLAPKPCADTEKPAGSTIISALRNQNSLLTKKVKVLKDVSNQREAQVNSLKRKVQQETLIRKCKERRITYISSKGKTCGMEENDEIVLALRDELAILQEQVQAQPHDSIEWVIKYKEEKARVDEMKAIAASTFESNEKTELEASIVSLLEERDILQQKVNDLSNERNVEIDAIINDVTKLENSNHMLQSQLDEKEATIKANEKKIQSDAVHIDELQQEMKATLNRLEMTQKELETGMLKTLELQESIERCKIEVSNANEALADHQCKLEESQNILETATNMHEKSLSALKSEIHDVQMKLNEALNENDSLIQKLKDVSDDLKSKVVQLDNLEIARNEALQLLDLSESKNDADVHSFKLREDALMAEIEGMKANFDSILAEKSQAFDMVNAVNASLLGEVDELKTKLDNFAALEDELTLANIESEHSSKHQIFTEADLERTIRLQDHLSDTQFFDFSSELARNEKNINYLSREKTKMQKELANVSQQLLDKTNEFNDKITILVEKDQAIEMVNAQNASLLDEAKEMKMELDSLQCRIASTHDIAAALEDENTLINIGSARILERQTFIEADIERTIRLHDHLSETQFAALSFELSTDEDIINGLSRENNNMRIELSNVSQQLLSKTDLFEEKISSLENDISDLRKTASKLEAEQERADFLQKENAEIILQLEQLTSQNDSFSAAIEALSSERDELQQALRAAITKLETGLTDAAESTCLLNKRLVEVSDELDEKNTQLQTLEAERNEGAKQLLQIQEQHNASIESFKLRELSVAEGITKTNETIASLLADKAATEEDLEETTLRCTTLVKELETVKSQVVALQKKCDTVSTVEAEMARVITEKKELEVRLEVSEAKLDEMAAALAAAHSNDGKIDMLQMEKADIQKELDNISKRSSEKERAMGEQIASLMSDVTTIREEMKAKVRNEKELQAKLDSNKLENITLKAQLSLANEKILDLEAADESSMNERAKSQAECERLNAELRNKTDRVNELESLLENANAKFRELSENAGSVSVQGEIVPAIRKSTDEDGSEGVNKQPIMMPSSEKPPDWGSSPINSSLPDSSFCADDTFDESMFLPNVQDEPKSPPTDENMSPPTPLTSNKRVLFSPAEDVTKVKAAGKTESPVQRMTRSMRNKARTPLGKSAVQNASSATRKVRTKRQKNGA